jgi:hypothetical protein
MPSISRASAALLAVIFAPPAVLAGQSATPCTEFFADKRARATSAACINPEAAENEHGQRIVSVARSSWELIPYVGMYTPVGMLVEPADRPAHRAKRQVSSLSVGARLAYRLSDQFRLEGGIGYSPSLTAVAEENTVVDLHTNVLNKSARIVGHLEARSRMSEWSFHLGTGYGMITRIGAAWERTRSTVDHAVVFAGGARLSVHDLGIAFRFDVEDYVTRGVSVGERRHPLRHDLIWSVGVAVPMSR